MRGARLIHPLTAFLFSHSDSLTDFDSHVGIFLLQNSHESKESQYLDISLCVNYAEVSTAKERI